MTELQKRWIKAVGLSTLLIISPALIIRSAFCDIRLWLLYVLVILLIGSQPSTSYVKLGEGDNAKEDQGSIRWIILAGYLNVLLPLANFYWRHDQGDFPFHVSSCVGGTVAIFGMLFRIYSIRLLGRWFTADVRIQSDHQLIEEGPYRFIRHPSYTGNFLFMAAIPLLLGVSLWMLVMIPLWLIVYRKRVGAEEAALETKFGSAYTSYKSRTSALFPGVW